MSRLFSTLTKQVNDHQFTHLYILEKFCTDCKILKGLYFCCVSFWKKSHNICYFSHQMCFLFNVIFFIWKRSRHSKNCFAYSEKFILSKTCQNCLVQIKDSHTVYTFSSCLVIIDSKLPKTFTYVCLSIFLKSMKTLNLIFSYEKYKLNTFRWCIYNFSKNFSKSILLFIIPYFLWFY